MTQPFTLEQSRDSGDRIVESIVAVFGEEPEARHCRVIAYGRFLEAGTSNEFRGEAAATVTDAVVVRLKCLGLALQLDGRNPQRAVKVTAAFEREVTSGFKSGAEQAAANDATRTYIGLGFADRHGVGVAAAVDGNLAPLPPEDSGPHGSF